LSNFGIFGKLAMTLECVLRNDKTSAADWFLFANGNEVDDDEFLLDECDDFDKATSKSTSSLPSAGKVSQRSSGSSSNRKSISDNKESKKDRNG
jgi:hypothetical protein